MTNLIRGCRRFFRSEDGPTAVEYAVMLAMIVVVSLATIRSLGTNANKSVKQVSNALKKANKK